MKQGSQGLLFDTLRQRVARCADGEGPVRCRHGQGRHGAEPNILQASVPVFLPARRVGRSFAKETKPVRGELKIDEPSLTLSLNSDVQKADPSAPAKRTERTTRASCSLGPLLAGRDDTWMAVRTHKS